MNAMQQLMTLAIATMLAVAASAGMLWLSLQMTFLMMRPATARKMPERTELARGTAQLARAYSPSR